MGSLSYGELAGERMKLGLLLHDPEEEHDCFSDNTAYQPLLRPGRHGLDLPQAKYTRLDGSVVEGASIRDFAAAKNPEAAKRVDGALAATSAGMAGRCSIPRMPARPTTR